MKNRLEQFESKMQSPQGMWLLNIFLAIVIFANAEVGHLLGIRGLPVSVSVVWASTGFALAAILLLGYSTWPGILLGNLAYNFLHLFSVSDVFVAPFITGLVMAAGSLLQAIVGGFIMRKYTSIGYFTTVKDVVIFLLPVGILATMISCSIGVIALYFYGTVTSLTIGHAWFTFWLGDSMGILIFTPLLVVWTLHRSIIPMKNFVWEGLVSLALFIFLSWLVFVRSYPLAHFFIPLSMWVSYRFRMYGATLFVFLTMLVAVISTSQGHGAFTQPPHPLLDPLYNVVGFLEVIVCTCLLLAACANDKESAATAKPPTQ